MHSFDSVEQMAFKIIHWSNLRKFSENFAMDYSPNGNGNGGNVAYALNAAICESCLRKLYCHVALEGDSQIGKKSNFLCNLRFVRVYSVMALQWV
jgi:hypothetical protein